MSDHKDCTYIGMHGITQKPSDINLVYHAGLAAITVYILVFLPIIPCDSFRKISRTFYGIQNKNFISDSFLSISPQVSITYFFIIHSIHLNCSLFTIIIEFILDFRIFCTFGIESGRIKIIVTFYIM